MSSNSQVLPPREASLFKKILKHFKEKQFKNGLKIANQILSNQKFAEHGETLSMKGLILNSMGKKQEALEYVKRGLKNDVKSHVCWHVFGLLQKADHKYEEAIKCYRNALRLKKDSVQILSDLCLVQIQTRDLEGYRDSRYKLFTLRPGERSTWIGCAMAFHLTGDHVTSVNILSEYQKSSSTSNNIRNRNGRRQMNEIYEHSELLLYNVFILLECSRYEDALKILEEHENEIVDKVSYYEYKCQIYLALEHYKEAQKVLTEHLISRNPENANYFDLMEKALQVNDELSRLKLYDQLAKSYPRSQTIARIPLMFVSCLKTFQIKMGDYLKNGFRKGRPALFRDLKNLYNVELSKSLNSFTYSKLDLKSLTPNLSMAELQKQIEKGRHIRIPPKIEVIERLLLSYMENLKLNNSFDVEEEKEAVTCLLWVYYFLAQHFDALKEFSMALHFSNCAMAHTPTLIDIFVIKAKIFKHAGFPEKAAKYLDEAQSLDTSDRYLNSKCAKYLIRINKIKESEDMCVKFTRENVPAQENLNEMQCMWFQTEMANSYKRLGMWGEALKKCVEVDNHFAEINEDQLDFNSYCILKVTLRAYVQMIRLQDHIKSHNFFINASKTAIEVYLRLYDKPVGNQLENNDDSNSHLSASELRKMRNKMRKAILKAERENEKSQKKGNEKRDNESKSENTDYIDPSKLEKSEQPLDDALRFLNPVKIFGKNLVEVHLLAFEIYHRKGKLLLQLQCLKRAYRICPVTSKCYPTLLRQTCLFLESISSRKEQFNETMRQVFCKELPSLDVINISTSDGDNVDIFNRLPNAIEFIRKHLPDDSLSFSTRVEHVNYLLSQLNNTTNDGNNVNVSQPSIELIKTKLSHIIRDMATFNDLTLEKCQNFYDVIKMDHLGKIPTEIVEQLRQTLHTLYPYASRFMNESELQELETELSVTDYFTAETDDCNCKNIEDN